MTQQINGKSYTRSDEENAAHAERQRQFQENEGSKPEPDLKEIAHRAAQLLFADDPAGHRRVEASKKPKPVQRIRINQCKLKLYSLTDDKTNKVSYICQLEKGHTGSCQERGVVVMDNGFGLEYTITWSELGPYEARKMKERIK